MQNKVPGWTSDEEEAEKQRAYNAELVDRYQKGLWVGNLGAKEARRLIRQTKAFAKQANT